MPPVEELRRIFDLHPDQTTRWIHETYGWPCHVSTAAWHRRRLRDLVVEAPPPPIRGAASMTDASFWGRVDACRRERYLGRLP
jgi:hypothetical protein